MTARIGFIGAGKMAEALIEGLISKQVFSKDEIIACAPSEGTRKHMSEAHGIAMYQTAAEVTSRADMVVLAVKPKQVEGVFVGEGTEVKPGAIVLSVVAGLSIEKLKSYVPDAKIVRVMPNHCVAVLEGAMGYATDGTLADSEKAQVASVFEAVGLAVEISEEQMDVITGLAGSSPAFLYMVIDAMADAGVLNGLPRKDAIRLAAQSMLGSAKMVLESGKHPDVLRDEVCSPAGTTIEGVRAAEDMGLRPAMIAAVDAAVAKSKSMSK
ncbi:MAG: pyrroline-5-carboxylate reductase [Thermoplasmata archaeon]|nr:pyrroline-5-carboxylate reductase [Thermoplasmata archaeon]